MRPGVRFGPWLKQQRRSRHLTQEDLAERLACSAVLIQKIEAGERTASKQVAVLVADWLGIAADDRSKFLSFAREEPDAHAWAEFGSTAPPLAPGRGSLPTSLTPLIGRAHEVEAVGNLLMDEAVRLLTLTGPPGIGKTSLAVQVAHDLKSRFSDGVAFVGLATILDPDLVAAAIAQALGVHAKSADPLSVVHASVRDRRMLLLVDNFEQVLDASPLILELLAACPNLKVLTTSREALYVHGEQQYPVPALGTADPANLPPVETLGSIPAVALFVERAKAVKPDFALSEQNAGGVATICARLDGLPLAIELAAARVRLFSPHELQSRLDGRLSLLTGGPRNLPPRQRTLRAAIDWSYNLLNNEEQTLFARLGVFVGSFTLTAAEAVCGTQHGARSGDIPYSMTATAMSLSVSQGIGSLVDKNLIKREAGGGEESRFSMLQLVRDYSLERLTQGGEEEHVRGLHARYFLSMVEAAEEEMTQGKRQQFWLDTLEQEHDNIRSALRWLLASGDPANAILALRLSGALRPFWHSRGHKMEGRRWLEAALASAAGAPSLVRAKALRAMGQFAQGEDDFEPATEWLEESLALCREAGDIDSILGVMETLAFSMIIQGNLERAIALGKEGLGMAFDPTLQVGVVRLLYTTAGAALFKSDFTQAEEFATRGLALGRGQAGEETCAGFLNCLGLAAHYQGNYERAATFYDEGLSIARQVGAHGNLAHMMVNMGDMALLQGDPARAGPLLAEGLSVFVKMGDKQGIAEGLEGIATLAEALGQAERSARLFGAAGALREAGKIFLPMFARTLYERTIAASRSRIGEEAFSKAWAEGRAMILEQAIEYALEEC